MSGRRQEMSHPDLGGGEKQREETREIKRGKGRERNGKGEKGRSGSFSL